LSCDLTNLFNGLIQRASFIRRTSSYYS